VCGRYRNRSSIPSGAETAAKRLSACTVGSSGSRSTQRPRILSRRGGCAPLKSIVTIASFVVIVPVVGRLRDCRSFLVAVESGGEFAQQRGELAAARGGEPAEDGAFLDQQIRQRGVDGGAAAVGELDQHTATIPRVAAALDPAACDEPVDAIGHGAAGHERLLEQRRRGELIRLTPAPEGGAHVEGPALDAVLGEARLARKVQLPGQTREAGEAPHRSGGAIPAS